LNPFEILACRNGLLHIPTRRLLPATPQFFTLNGLEFDYDSNAPPPSKWLNFLDQLWPEDTESKNTLQEWIGYLLTPETRLQKMLMLIGPKRAGKGTIGRITRMLLGARNVCAPLLANMGQQFGMSVFVGRTAAIIADARISGRADTAAITEKLLSISGEDPQTIPRKFLPDWNGFLPTRFMLMTNELPKIEDASGTLPSRFIILALTESFYGRENHKLLASFMRELPGILLWALEGWDRLYQRGRFIQPQSSLELISQFEDLGSPTGAFVRDKCEIGPGYDIRQDHLFEAWKSYCAETGRDHTGTIQTFGRNLQSFVPWLKVTRPRILGVQIRYYTGIRLKGTNKIYE
jgi:putative DNA primase/helicase